MQLDDLTPDLLDRVRPAAFLMHETSPGNFQAWIAVRDVPNSGEAFKDFMRRIRKAVGGNDKSASHATRLGGTENFMPAYVPANAVIHNPNAVPPSALPDYPTVTMIHTIPGRMMTPEQLQATGLLAEPERFVPDIDVSRKAPARVSSISGRPWPSYDKALAGAPRTLKALAPAEAMQITGGHFCRSNGDILRRTRSPSAELRKK